MKQLFNILILLALCTSSMTLVSCQETDEVSEYDNWEVRNQLFIDSIAKVCETNADGKWVRFCAYNLDSEYEAQKGDKNHYIYVHKNVEGTGTYKPQYNDTVRVHYFGHLIPSMSHSKGYNYDKSYNGYTLDEKTDVPAKLATNRNVTGFTTSLMQMVEGDDWTIYIPAFLGYGTADNPVPANSTLIFELKLAKVYVYGKDTDTTWR